MITCPLVRANYRRLTSVNPDSVYRVEIVGVEILLLRCKTMFVSPKNFLLGSVLLLSSLPAPAAEENASVAPVAAVPRASVKCPGITSVPLTADAEQALPMRQVGTLQCGDSVMVLSDSEGYTARVRSGDGTEGYVARMYLTMGDKGSTAVSEVVPASASPMNGVVRWQVGTAGCEYFASKGHTVESAVTDGVTVQVSLEDTGWKLRATIAITNNSRETLEVAPHLVSLDELQPSLKALLPLDPSRLSHVVNHQVLRTEANAQPSHSALVFRSHNGATLTATSYRQPTVDHFSESAVPQVNEAHGTPASGSDLQALALKHVKLEPGKTTTGTIWFERDTNARELSLRVPVGDLVFDFPLAFNSRK